VSPLGPLQLFSPRHAESPSTYSQQSPGGVHERAHSAWRTVKVLDVAASAAREEAVSESEIKECKGKVQSGLPPPILCIHVRTALEQHIHNPWLSALPSGIKSWSRL
jgi:hypothetical protein